MGTTANPPINARPISIATQNDACCQTAGEEADGCAAAGGAAVGETIGWGVGRGRVDGKSNGESGRAIEGGPAAGAPAETAAQ